MPKTAFKKDKGISLRIKQLRDLHGLGVEEFARSIGYDNSSLGKVEAGKLGVTLQLIDGIISNYGVSYKWLVHGEEGEFQKPIVNLNSKDQAQITFLSQLLKDQLELAKKTEQQLRNVGGGSVQLADTLQKIRDELSDILKKTGKHGKHE